MSKNFNSVEKKMRDSVVNGRIPAYNSIFPLANSYSTNFTIYNLEPGVRNLLL